MNTGHPDYEFEINHLEQVCKRLKRDISIKDMEISSFKSEITAIRKSMWENAKHGFGGNETEAMIEATQYISAMKNEENSYKFSRALLDKYKRLLYSPYFARIDFTEKADRIPERIYIGLYSFINTDTMEVLIHDWRAPVSSMFYEYEQGAAEYMAGEEAVRGEISVKRQFKIKDSKLLYMFDSSVKIDDELLQELLSSSAGERMKSIVTTIQREQNRVIRFDEGSMLVVQGAAGSGKTSIALHRIAYLLYKDRKLSSNNIMIFSPNHIFNDYISNVLPELGESNVIQTTLDEYAGRLIGQGLRLESFSRHMEYLLYNEAFNPEDIRIKGYRLKNSEGFLEAVRAFAIEKSKAAEQLCNIYYEGRLAVGANELEKVYRESSGKLPINKRLSSVRARAFYLLEKTQEKKKAELLRKAQDEKSNAREAAAAARMELQREFREARDKVLEMTRLEPEDIYRSFYQSKHFAEAGKAFGLTMDEINALGRYSIENINGRFVSYEDANLLAYFKCIIDEIPDAVSIKHVVIDEAQDYSPLQYEVFKSLFPKSSFTVLGDKNQLVNSCKTSRGFQNITGIFGRPASTVLELRKTYRSTKEISDFTRELLPEDIMLEGLERPGRLPEVIRLSKDCDIKKLLLEDIKDLLSEGMKSIAVLCRTAEECRTLFKLLGKEIELGLVVGEDDLYRKGVNILPSYFCKGLEFDAALVYGADEVSYRAGRDEKLLYTLCTRALHRLNIYYSGNLTPIISRISGERYKSRSC